jgi:glycerophosphoryl diester phosphodiesterase
MKLKALFLAFQMAAQIVVISHRGEHLSHPENTLPAFQAAIDAGADYFELDVRTTSDGQLVLMHDGTVDRTTNGHGAVKEMTFAQIRALDAGSKMNAQFAGTRVPTLEEALTLAHGKIGIYVDCKSLEAKALVSMLEKTDMSDKVVVYGNPFFLKDVQALNPSLKIMPEADSTEILTKLIENLKLQVVAFDHKDFQPDVIAKAKQNNLLIYVDRLWMEDNPDSWLDAVNHGAAGIQTDHPAEAVRLLREKGMHK